jgi:hypothetical protein
MLCVDIAFEGFVVVSELLVWHNFSNIGCIFIVIDLEKVHACYEFKTDTFHHLKVTAGSAKSLDKFCNLIKNYKFP